MRRKMERKTYLFNSRSLLTARSEGPLGIRAK